MNRSEHLQWCKDRAIAYIDAGDLRGAFASFQSDMSKHEQTENHMALDMGTILMVNGQLGTPHEMKEWIEGFN